VIGRFFHALNGESDAQGENPTHIMNEGRPFDAARYVAVLRRLPELPYDSDA